MKAEDRYDLYQLRALCAVLLFSPALRFCPTASVNAAGKAAWLSAPAGLPAVLLYAVFLRRFLFFRRADEGLAELCARAVGERAARPLLIGAALWFAFYAGFVLRAGAERFITTIYPHSGPSVFVVVLGLLCALAAMGPARTLVRTAKLVLPLLIGALGLILVTGLFSARLDNLLPVTGRDLVPVLHGSLSVIDVLSGILILGAFLAGGLPADGGRAPGGALALAGAAGFLSLLDAAIIGNFGAELAAELTRPLFYLVRNLVFFRSVERVEALMVTLWVFPDFLLTACSLSVSQRCLRLALGRFSPWRGEKILSFSHGRLLIPLCSASALLAALLMAPDQRAFLFLSGRLIPALNLGFALLVLPGAYLTGKRKRRL